MYKYIIKLCCLIFVIILVSNTTFAQKKEYKVKSIGFYNLENLFDLINQEEVRDDEFTPDGAKKWNEKKYAQKMANISKVISDIGTNVAKSGLSILGVSEIENISVLKDLANTELLKNRNYGIVHKDSPDKRGIDVALMYQKDHFKVTNYRAVPLIINDKDDNDRVYTRDQLVVSGLLDGEKMHFIVNHWPSRSGGEAKSAYLRNAAGKLCKTIKDSILKVEPAAKIVIMGDFNDTPNNKSVKKYLGAKKDRKKVSTKDLYNTAAKFQDRGFGSHAYRDTWSMLDQIIISGEFLNKNTKGFKYYKAKIYRKKYLLNQSGRYKGYPKRTFVGNTFQGGYSDHFPVFMFIVKEK